MTAAAKAVALAALRVTVVEGNHDLSRTVVDAKGNETELVQEEPFQVRDFEAVHLLGGPLVRLENTGEQTLFMFLDGVFQRPILPAVPAGEDPVTPAEPAETVEVAGGAVISVSTAEKAPALPKARKSAGREE